MALRFRKDLSGLGKTFRFEPAYALLAAAAEKMINLCDRLLVDGYGAAATWVARAESTGVLLLAKFLPCIPQQLTKSAPFVLQDCRKRYLNRQFYCCSQNCGFR